MFRKVTLALSATASGRGRGPTMRTQAARVRIRSKPTASPTARSARRTSCATSSPPASRSTTYADDHSVIQALRTGACGLLTKDAGSPEIAAALQAAKRGESAIDPLSSTTSFVRHRGAGAEALGWTLGSVGG